MATTDADALLVVDMQCGLLTGPSAIPQAASVLAAVNRLVQTARDSEALIVHIQNDGSTDAPDEPGTPGWALAIGPAVQSRSFANKPTTPSQARAWR